MPYDPALPANHSPLVAAEMRAQLTGLKALIDDVPAGPQGDPGPEGPQGSPGSPGPQGPPFADAVVDGVNTVSPGDPAAVGVSFDGSVVHFTFDIPQGAPGEVTTAALDAAIAGTSSNSNAVTTLEMTVSDPPTQAEVQAIADKVDELIGALRR